MFGWFRRKPAAPIKVEMTEIEKKTILDFARGDPGRKAAAIAIHRKYIPTIGAQGDLYQRFMAEIDTDRPDAGLRSTYRAALLSPHR